MVDPVLVAIIIHMYNNESIRASWLFLHQHKKRITMKTIRHSIVMLFITALLNTSYAGQSNEDATQGTNAEPECDYASAPEFL